MLDVLEKAKHLLLHLNLWDAPVVVQRASLRALTALRDVEAGKRLDDLAVVRSTLDFLSSLDVERQPRQMQHYVKDVVRLLVAWKRDHEAKERERAAKALEAPPPVVEAHPTEEGIVVPGDSEGRFLNTEDLVELANPELRSSPFQKALADRMAKRAPIVKRQPGRTRDWMLPFTSVIPPRSSLTLQQQPQVLFRGEDILYTGDKGLRITQLFVGQKLQLPYNSDGFDVELWRHLPDREALRSGMKIDTCDPALYITIQAYNPTDAPLTFDCCIKGKAAI